jgi:predicted dehydrogenase
MTATFGIAPGPCDHTIALHGRDGYLQLRVNDAEDRRARPFTLAGIALRLFGDDSPYPVDRYPSDGWETGFVRMWEDYATGISEWAPTRVTAPDGRAAVEIIQAAYQANRLGQTACLPLAGPA